MEHAYAEALWKLVAGGMSPSKAVKGVRESLEREGRGALMPRIGKAFARIAEREGARTRVTLTVAREKDERAARSAAKEMLASLEVASKDVDVRVDDSLIGGWRLEGRETLLDKSYKTQLLDLFNKSVR